MKIGHNKGTGLRPIHFYCHSGTLGMILFGLLGFSTHFVSAQNFPSRPVRIVVPFSPGGASDVIARTLALKLTDTLGQSVVVDNHPGAGGNIGIGFVAKAAPDGYTLLVSSSAFTVNPTLYANSPYDALKDFQMITCVGSSPNVLAVQAAHPAKSVKELIELVRSQPNKHNYSSPGAGTTPHLSGEMFRLAFNIDLRHIPYGGAGPQLQSLIGGQVPIGFASVPSFAPQIKAGALRGLAVTAEKRMTLLPEVPSMGELGFPAQKGDTFQGLFAPVNTAKSTITRIHSDVMKIMASQDMKDRLEAIAMLPVGNSPDEFTQQVKNDITRWGKVVRDSGIKPD